MRCNRALILAAYLSLIGTLFGGEPEVRVPERIRLAELDNVFRVTQDLYSGSSPETEAAFAGLKKLGIKSIISVDGARPKIELAKKFGLRYVHLPIGYDGISPERSLQIAKAARELPKPIYVHCHHGKHRGPAGAAVAQLCLDGNCRIADALAVMKSAGTDPRYKGLFKSVEQFKRPTDEELKRLPAELPEVVEAKGLALAMVGIDQSFDNLKLARAAGWKSPPVHPDLDPPHEALQIVESFQELLRSPAINQRPSEFRKWLEETRTTAIDLENALRTWKEKGADKDSVERAFAATNATCTRCHAKFRDVPKQ